MEKLKKQASVRGPEQMFTGEVYFDGIFAGQEPSRMRANSVHFAPGARTAWHCHTEGQTLYVTEGVGLVQARGGEILQMHPGDVVYTPPGEWHWHGADPEHFMTHIAMWESPRPGNDAPESEWGAHITEEEYRVRSQPS
ncbi:cupin domain-containing protein [Nakamurella silvestris]|nr:cupin domain-containing protein [Nakamurella silvestris]